METRCVTCGAQWWVDYQPPGCVCDDGGLWQLRVDGQEWEPERGVNAEGVQK